MLLRSGQGGVGDRARVGLLVQRDHPRAPHRGGVQRLVSAVDRAAAEWRDVIILAAGVLIGVVLLRGGIGKLFGLGGFAAGLARNGMPDDLAFVLAVLGAVVEFLCGLFILLGLYTRVAALLAILFVIIATALSHRF